MAIEIVSFPIKNGGSFHSYVSLPEGSYYPPLCLPTGAGKLCQVPIPVKIPGAELRRKDSESQAWKPMAFYVL